VAKAKGRLRGKQPKLKPNQAKHLLELHDSGSYTQGELAELFGVGRSTVYRTIQRMRPKPPELERPFAHLTDPQARDRRPPTGPADKPRIEVPRATPA
jgi:IS30 family transposase